LKAGCQWYVDWFKSANNPTVRYKEVQCSGHPALLAKYK
jgi:hypothetical protein